MKATIENRPASGVDRLALRADVTINGVPLTPPQTLALWIAINEARMEVMNREEGEMERALKARYSEIIVMLLGAGG
jgi:hypothetical protein